MPDSAPGISDFLSARDWTLFCSIAMFWCLLPSKVLAQIVDPTEKATIDYVDTHLNDAVALIKKIVDIESPTENLQGVKSVGMELRKELETTGMTARWIDMPATKKRAGHLVAETKGTKGKRILMLGQLDTVLSGEKFRREGNRIFGTGTGDMKGGRHYNGLCAKGSQGRWRA